jgi:leucyl-tRNA synthetase
MPQWAGSSWYYLRFMDPHNSEALVGKDKEKYWVPVDVYVGGDHAVRHLIYARFWHKFLYDIGSVSTVEPFARLEFLGFILAEDGTKMSKSKGNTVSPDEVVKTYGADSFRIYEMFMGPFENTVAWSTASIVGTRRFVERVWKMGESVATKAKSVAEPADVRDSAAGVHEVLLHQTIKKVSEDIEAFKFNTAISQMMVFLNAAEKAGSIEKSQWELFLKILSPFAPHVTSELWEMLGHDSLLSLEPWPQFDEAKITAQELVVAVQVNGKMRGTVSLTQGATKEEAIAAAYQEERLAKWLPPKPLQEGEGGVQVIYVPGKIVSFIAKTGA